MPCSVTTSPDAEATVEAGQHACATTRLVSTGSIQEIGAPRASVDSTIGVSQRCIDVIRRDSNRVRLYVYSSRGLDRCCLLNGESARAARRDRPGLDPRA